MTKNLEDMNFDELVRFGVQIELDDIVSGKPLSKRVYGLMELAARWSTEQKNKKNAA